jgi:hypothetical protein
MSSLEQKVTAALASVAVTSADLAALIRELEGGIADANENAERERRKALDPLASPDAKAAHELLKTAEFSCERLQALLPRLRQRCQQVAGQEHYDRWAAELDQLVPRYAAAVEQLKSVCEAYEPQLITVLIEAQAVDAEVRRLANTKPFHLSQTNNDGRNLREVELAARGLAGVASGCSLVRDIKLPAFAESNRLAWPLPQPLIAVEVAKQVGAITAHPGANWWKAIEKRNRAVAEESRKPAARQAAEREQRFKEAQERERAADEQRRLERHRALGWPV